MNSIYSILAKKSFWKLCKIPIAAKLMRLNHMTDSICPTMYWFFFPLPSSANWYEYIPLASVLINQYAMARFPTWGLWRVVFVPDYLKDKAARLLVLSVLVLVLSGAQTAKHTHLNGALSTKHSSFELRVILIGTNAQGVNSFFPTLRCKP